MNLLVFVSGLVLGLGVCELRRYRFNRQVRQMLGLFPRRFNEESSLALVSRLRRAINLLVQHQQQVERELEMWKRVLERSPIGYLQIDPSNQLQWCNSTARQMLRIERWRPDQLRLLLELVRSYELDQMIQETRRSQHPQSQEWVFKTTHLPSGSVLSTRSSLSSPQPASQTYAYSLAIRASTLPIQDGQVIVFLEDQQFMVDLTQARDRAFSDLTHELRTPLTSISLVAEALQSRLNPPEKTWVEKMLKEIDRLISLIQDCLEISKLQTNPHQTLNRETVRLKPLLDSVWHSLEPLSQPKQLTLSYQGDATLELYADSARLTQVFLNIFDNSIKHSPPNTTIQVQVNQSTLSHCSDPDSWITINVIDSGPGFLESDIAHVFERLYRGDPSRQRSSSERSTSEEDRGNSPMFRKGSGLGLSIVQQIIEAHGGTITARNHPETRGAWLQIKLPNVH
ncbi:PAS domain-containing sensor histidine kinase [Spirulina subsalsa FACHB-351]|uniref:histidine kinase n=1 Tax=Spirulina subsalsa FACHB-351 TaxID=234711 RepID=A0ABT3L2C2_9CYAN|nr:PAS domain-containing sensor histidine kinase [Spirulina subsalsa]MCW6035170.1 PAS domain-containing sensor histidine kinase [Spirulina subsalsa FACHB-351]